MTDTETLDRLYLEWSQFTKARTKRELKAEAQIERLRKTLRRIANNPNLSAIDFEQIREVIGDD